MAVTITNTFNDVVALQKPLVLTASSTNTSEPKFRYVMTVDVNSVEVIKVKQQANQMIMYILTFTKSLKTTLKLNIWMEALKFIK
jgi:hypothetical protein